MHLIATLVRSIGPDAVILVRLDVARHLGELERDTHLRVLGVEGESRAEAVLKATEAVLATGPLAERELAGLAEVGVNGDEATVDLLVEPLAVATDGFGLIVNITDVDGVRGFYGEARLALLVLA